MAAKAFIARVDALVEQLALVWADAPDELFEEFLAKFSEHSAGRWSKTFPLLKSEDIVAMIDNLLYRIRTRRRAAVADI